MTSLQILDCLIERHNKLSVIRNDIKNTADTLVECFQSGGKLILCGNGGSAGDCDHIAAELLKSFLIKRTVNKSVYEKIKELFPEDADYLYENLEQGLPVISIPSQMSAMTAFANDVCYEMFFAQQILSFAKPGDVVMLISTSGNSLNIINAAKIAKVVDNVKIIGMTNIDGGKLKYYCDILLNVPEKETFKAQEYHVAVYHAFCAMVEADMFGIEMNPNN